LRFPHPLKGNQLNNNTNAKIKKHIADRWRDAVSNRPPAPHTADIDLAADEFLSDNPHRGGYHGMRVPGA
jgi:hypothetical protein